MCLAYLRSWSVNCGDAEDLFLHSPLDAVFAKPPPEDPRPGPQEVWRLREAIPGFVAHGGRSPPTSTNKLVPRALAWTPPSVMSAS